MEKYEKKYVKVKCKDGIYYRNIVPWLSQIPKYQEIYEKHEKAESEIEQYREECKERYLEQRGGLQGRRRVWYDVSIKMRGEQWRWIQRKRIMTKCTII